MNTCTRATIPFRRTVARIAGLALLLTSGKSFGQQLVEGPGSQTVILGLSEASPCRFEAAFTGSDTASSCDLEKFRLRARSGSLYDVNQLGLVLCLAPADGHTLPEARTLFLRAARKGYAPAEANLGAMYLNGWGVPRNYGTGIYWLQLAAQQHNAKAFANLGLLYLNGWGVRQDYPEARRYLQNAADAGDTGAMSNVGYLYDHGLGVVQDRAAAAEWYREAADRGNSMGQNNLADLYLRGEGVPQSDSAAFELFQKAAAQGQTGAQIKLGFLYLSGRGTAPDLQSAYAWITTASEAGDRRGDQYIPYLKAHLSTEQLARPGGRARDFEPPSPPAGTAATLSP